MAVFSCDTSIQTIQIGAGFRGLKTNKYGGKGEGLKFFWLLLLQTFQTNENKDKVHFKLVTILTGHLCFFNIV